MKKLILLGIVVLVIGAILTWQFASPTEDTAPSGVAGEPIDIALDFYNAWLNARKTGNDTQNLLQSATLSQEMKERLKDFDFSTAETELDPVLCQTTLPDGFRSKFIFEKENAVQLLVLSSERGVGNQASVSLDSRDGLWEITDISCTTGEQAPDKGEFSFDTTGHLLKDSLPNTFDKNRWHLVFSENGVPGHTAPLVFDEASMCTKTDGSTNVCEPKKNFREAMQVRVQGQLTESGVAVNRLEVITTPK